MSIPTKKVQKESKSDHSVFRKQENSKSSLNKQNSPAQDILNLHQTIGNQAVQRLFESGFIQGKLTVGKPNDKYEQEADRVADEVMRMPEPQVQRQNEEDEEEEMIQAKPVGEQITPLVQRQVEPAEEEEAEPEKEEEETIQAKVEGQTPQVIPSLESKINALQGGGQSLSKETRNFFEPRFGTDFSNVKIHTDSNANQLARSINARAFTRGNDVVFGGGEYSPENSGGKRLLGHELAHVVQQTGLFTGALKLIQRQDIPKEEEKLNKLKEALKVNYGLADVVDGDAKWSIDQLQQVTEAFKLLPTGDKKALKGVVLKRVISIGNKTAGVFSYKQRVTGTTVTNEAILELANSAFKTGAFNSYHIIIHEAGHAVASLELRTAAHAEHQAIAESNRLLELSNQALDASTEAREERNETVEPTKRTASEYNDAVKKYNIARKTSDKVRIAAAKKDVEVAKQAYEAAMQAYKKKKTEDDRLKALWKKAEKKTKVAQKVDAQKAGKTSKTKISASDLGAIKKKSEADKKKHDSNLTAANKKVASLDKKKNVAEKKYQAALKSGDKVRIAAAKKEYENAKKIRAESNAYISAIQEASIAIKEFAEQTKSQTLSDDDVERLVNNVQDKISARNTERGNLTAKNKSNPALSIFIKVEHSQDAWFESAKAHSLAHNRSARVQRFVKFVEKKKISPRTIFPPDSYAEQNWPHKPEEFYAEVYSMFVVKPTELKAKSKTLYNWFKTKKY